MEWEVKEGLGTDRWKKTESKVGRAEMRETGRNGRREQSWSSGERELRDMVESTGGEMGVWAAIKHSRDCCPVLNTGEGRTGHSAEITA